jgi:hypothetical protein
MATMIPVLPGAWFDGVPAMPAPVGSTPAVMLALLAVLCTAVALLLRSRLTARGSRGRAALRVLHGSLSSPDPKPSPSSCAGGVEGYRSFLIARDGTADLQRHRLARREAFFAGLDAEPLRSHVSIDRGAFRRNLRRRQPEPGIDARMLWLLASAKANQAERFAIAYSELCGRAPAEDADPVRVHLHLQETYHTRILADVVALFGLTIHVAPPPIWNRALIKLMVLAPPRWVMPLIGCSEMIGCVIFQALRDRGSDLLADEPEVAARTRLLYDEILADEISHVGYVAAQLSRRGRAVMRWLYRRVGFGMVRQMPELTLLFGADDLQRRLRHFRHDALLAEYPDKAYAAVVV